MKRNEYVRTAIRWRPNTENREIVIQKVSNNLVGSTKIAEPFVVDHVFDSSDQSEVFDVLVQPLIEQAIKGYDFTFLATGQTGSGKTYTMGFERSVDTENSGIVTRVLNSLFTHEKANSFGIQISFVEVYNDQAFDLLSSTHQIPFFKKSDNPGHRQQEVIKQSVNSESEVLTLLSAGTEKRRVRETKMNSVSSRSHVVFTIYLNITQDGNSIRPSMINLVDLAGSESSKKTGNIGQAYQEAKTINEGLVTFKRVITAMTLPPPAHIPWRESVLTRILQDSLNRHSYLTLLGCVSPYKDDWGETLTTLRFVNETKKMKMTPQLNNLIIEYKKKMTPVKGIQTPSSSVKSFKHPLFPIHNKASSLLQNSEPNAKKYKRFTSSTVSSASKFRHVPSINSTSKKIDRNRLSQTPSSSSNDPVNKRKVVSNLFAVKPNDTTFINDKTFTSDSISGNFTNISSSSIIPLEQSLFEPVAPNTNQTAFNHMNILRAELAKKLAEISTIGTPDREKLINDAFTATSNKIAEQNETISAPSALHSLPSSSLLRSSIENCVNRSTPIKSVDKVETPMWSDTSNQITMIENDKPQKNLSQKSLTQDINVLQENIISSGNPQTNIIENLMEVDSKDDQILFTISPDHLPVDSMPPCVGELVDSAILNSVPFPNLDAIAEIPEVSSTKEATPTMIASLTPATVESLTPKMVEHLSPTTVENPKPSVSLVEENTSTTSHTEQSEVTQSYAQSFDETANNLMNTVTEMMSENVAAFISPLFVRKMENRSDLEMPSMYEIVKKDRCENCAEYSYSDEEYSLAEQQNIQWPEQSSVDTPNTPKAPVKASTAARNHFRFPFSPRIILNRIENLRDFQNSLKCGASQVPAIEARKSKRARFVRNDSPLIHTTTTRTKKKTTKTTKAKTKVKPIAASPNHVSIPVPNRKKIHENHNTILNILNSGNEKDLQKLSTIGKKTASLIVGFREKLGGFVNIDAMKKMPSWSAKNHQKFLECNFLEI